MPPTSFHTSSKREEVSEPPRAASLRRREKYGPRTAWRIWPCFETEGGSAANRRGVTPLCSFGGFPPFS